MAHSPKVRCKPYFKLRSQVHRISARPRPLAHKQNPGPFPLSALPITGPPANPAAEPSRSSNSAAAGSSPTSTPSSSPSTSPSPPSPTSPSTAPRIRPNQSVGSSNDADIEVALDIEAAGAILLSPPPASPPPSASIGRRTLPPPLPKPPRMAARSAPSPGALTRPCGAQRPPTKWNPPPPTLPMRA